MKHFPVILLIFFGVAIFLAVLIFSGAIKTGSSKNTGGASGTVTMWGTLPSATLKPLFEVYNTDKQTYGVKYVQKDPTTYADDLINALASGKGPDLYLLTPELLWRFRDKIVEIPFTSYAERTFRDTFIPGSAIFLTSTGARALPLTVDPLVMYYNRDLLQANFILTPPATWDDIFSFNKTVTKKSDTGILDTSGVALGSWDNVLHAKDILSALLFQSGVSITKDNGLSLDSTLASQVAGRSLPAQSVVVFYSEFANPVSEYYSWNEARPSSLDAFISGDLALYFGPASEISLIRAKNPNLNFDVALLPQIENASTKATFGSMNAVAISKFSTNLTTAYTVAFDITSKNFGDALAPYLYQISPRRDVLAEKITDPFRTVFYQSALISSAWIDPNPSSTNAIFRTMIKAYTSGQSDAGEAVRAADSSLSVVSKAQ